MFSFLFGVIGFIACSFIIFFTWAVAFYLCLVYKSDKTFNDVIDWLKKDREKNDN